MYDDSGTAGEREWEWMRQTDPCKPYLTLPYPIYLSDFFPFFISFTRLKHIHVYLRPVYPSYVLNPNFNALSRYTGHPLVR